MVRKWVDAVQSDPLLVELLHSAPLFVVIGRLVKEVAKNGRCNVVILVLSALGAVVARDVVALWFLLKFWLAAWLFKAVQPTVALLKTDLGYLGVMPCAYH